MVSIARAMALAPSLMILDEAFEGLAPVVVKRFRDAVMMIKGLGISLLLAESNLTSAAAIADRLYVIDRGEIIFHGTPQEALANDAVMRTLRG
jgi:branched-chain amino acid transport system ATP-binding protein